MLVNMLMKLTILLGTLGCLTNAHPGEEESPHGLSPAQKRSMKNHASRGLERCARHFEETGFSARAIQRRHNTVEWFKKNKLRRRDTDATLNKTHEVTNPAISPSTPEDILFSSNFSSNSTCVLNPEGETGPYYVKGEHIRNDVAEGQAGVPLILDGQFVDAETCEPITDLWWDLWNCNSTGVYSGVVADGNGNDADLSNINATFLRGVAKTDSDGVVQFHTVFPGHYSGRATHHHVAAHLNVTVLPNNTIFGGHVAYIGQLFYDQSLITEVESTYPYNTNTIAITENADDHVVIAETENTTSDPFVYYVKMGDDISDGLFGYITIAVNRSAVYDPYYGFVYTASGGIVESGGDSSNIAGDE